ncbi:MULTISPECIES: thioesterase family protein [Halomonadaceae]|uniref:acyl-CoA thioesterase n=1 Tax=Halomonadaceae TaxID=28256 RepID=UPI00159A4C07|nr:MULTISPECIES: thioesterase family protein [Halomonas]QJQ94577.1 acyl-CoA thioesterase [Halomonas sp. PA5]
MKWDLAHPYILPIKVEASAIDDFDHVNNIEYLRWIEAISWAHSVELGLDMARYREFDRAMAVHRHELDYLAPAFLGERLELATWIVACDGRLTLTRRFQLRRPGDDRTLLRACTRFACIELSTGRARRMPAEYVTTYGAALTQE